jgi:hypothetical protein
MCEPLNYLKSEFFVAHDSLIFQMRHHSVSGTTMLMLLPLLLLVLCPVQGTSDEDFDPFHDGQDL